ncbi:MAG TPA: hypothetical protein PKK31_11045, partial [Elusimicrobiales bacterium]|nr:hypothetical protein [Elusimicrobiales bacterium]
MNIPGALLFLSLLLPAGLAAEEEDYADASAELCEDLGKPFFSFSTLPAGGSAVTQGRRLGLPFSFLSPKPAGVYRVFVIGESAAALLGAEK